jgi:hypothetical protein
MSDDKMKIVCKWCTVSENCHIVSEETSEHQGAYGIDDVVMAKVKIHKHFKGKNCMRLKSIMKNSKTRFLLFSICCNLF